MPGVGNQKKKNGRAAKREELRLSKIAECTRAKAPANLDLLAMQQENQRQRQHEGKVFGLRTLVDLTNESFDHRMRLAEFFLENNEPVLATQHAQAAVVIDSESCGLRTRLNEAVDGLIMPSSTETAPGVAFGNAATAKKKRSHDEVTPPLEVVVDTQVSSPIAVHAARRSQSPWGDDCTPVRSPSSDHAYHNADPYDDYE